LSIDCGKKPGVKAADGMRRCRVLLGHPARTTLDFRLLAQVEVSTAPRLKFEGAKLIEFELNSIRGKSKAQVEEWGKPTNLYSGSACS
jgi:hypothetical protein